MSKKSRKRNKKILAALALAGGAAMMAKGRKKASIAGMDDAALGVTHSALEGPYITKKEPVIKKEVEPGIDYSKGNWKGFGHPIIQGNIQKKNEYIKRNTIPGYGSAAGPPSELNPYKKPFQKTRYRAKGGSAYKSGGSVTGIAKRGFGRALMKGKK